MAISIDERTEKAAWVFKRCVFLIAVSRRRQNVSGFRIRPLSCVRSSARIGCAICDSGVFSSRGQESNRREQVLDSCEGHVAEPQGTHVLRCTVHHGVRPSAVRIEPNLRVSLQSDGNSPRGWSENQIHRGDFTNAAYPPVAAALRRS